MKRTSFVVKALLFSSHLWVIQFALAASSEWSLFMNRGTSRPPIQSPAQLHGTSENLLMISTFDPEASLISNIAFSVCNYSIDLQPFTNHIIIKANQWFKDPFNDQSKEYQYHYRFKLDPHNGSNFGSDLAFLLSQSGYDGIRIDDINHEHHCHTTHDEAVLALSKDKIHPKNVYLTKSESLEQISLYDWIWKKIENEWRESELNQGVYEPIRLAQQFFDWLKMDGIYKNPCISDTTTPDDHLPADKSDKADKPK